MSEKGALFFNSPFFSLETKEITLTLARVKGARLFFQFQAGNVIFVFFPLFDFWRNLFWRLCHKKIEKRHSSKAGTMHFRGEKINSSRCDSYLKIAIAQLFNSPTDPFSILEPQNPSFNVSKLHMKLVFFRIGLLWNYDSMGHGARKDCRLNPSNCNIDLKSSTDFSS